MKNHEVFSTTKIVYEMYNQNDDFLVDADEKIIEKTKDKLIIEANSKNEFSLIQRILYKGSDCKVLEPYDFKLKIIEKLKTMEAI